MERLPVNSSNLVAIGYEKDSLILEIEFRQAVYRYADVPSYIYEELMNADSKGSYHHQNIKNAFSCEKV